MKSAVVLAALLGAFAANAAPIHYTLDPNHTQVLFSWDHLGYSHPTGQFSRVDGALIYDAQHPEKSSVRVSIPMASLYTHVPALDRQLLGPKFLDAAKYPAITFVSDKVSVAGHDNFEVEGRLTLHGTTRPVTLHVTLNKSGSYPMLDAPALGFGATTTFGRSAFGAGEGVPLVGDALQVTVSAEAVESHAFENKLLPLERQAENNQ